MPSQNLIRVLHTADWHLGRTLADQNREDEHQAFLDWLSEQIVERSIDVLLIAGDIFDSANPPHSAATQYYQFLSQIHSRSECHVVVVGGNHDSARHLESTAPILKPHRVHVVGGLPETLADCVIPLPSIADAQLIVAAVPFLRDRDVRVSLLGENSDEVRKALNEGIAACYREVHQACLPYVGRGVPVVAMGHLTVTGATTCSSEREIHIGGLGSLSADIFDSQIAYVALGHLHRPQSAGANGKVRYSGSPIALGFGEVGDQKEVRLLTFKDGQLIDQSPIAVPVYRELRRVKCSADDVERTIRQLDATEAIGGCWIELALTNRQLATISTDAMRQLPLPPGTSILQFITGDEERKLSLTSHDSKLAEEAIRDLRTQPKSVFAKRLDDEANLTPEQRDALELEFASLLDELHAREIEAASKPPEAKRRGKKGASV